MPSPRMDSPFSRPRDPISAFNLSSARRLEISKNVKQEQGKAERAREGVKSKRRRRKLKNILNSLLAVGNTGANPAY